MDSSVDVEFRGVDGTLIVSNSVPPEKATEAHIEKLTTSQVNTLCTAPNGTILIPQPTEDPGDTLNWSQRKKWTILALVSFCAAMPDLQAAWGSIIIVPQSIYWNTAILEIERSLSGNTFMIGAGGVLAVPLVQRFGRLPVLFWSMLGSFGMTLFCTLAPNPTVFIVARCLQTTFSAAPEVIGLSFIYDMFFFHERARAVGIWAWSFIQSPFVGPFLSGIIANYKPWRVSFGVCTAISGLALLLVIVFGAETLYDRHTKVIRPRQPKGMLNRRIQELTGVYGARVQGRPTVLSSAWHILVVASRPYLLLLLIYYSVTFMWSVGINATLNLFLFTPTKAGGYGFSELGGALIYVSPITATFLGEVFGYFFNDWVTRSHIKKHQGIFEPEARLYAVWVATPFMSGGLILLGFSLQYQFHWIAVAFAWGIYCFGTFSTNSCNWLVATVGITAYALDIFQDRAAEASGLINFSRTISGFIVNYFQIQWASKIGAAASFGTQGAICFVAWLLVAVVQHKGKAWRERFPSSSPRSHEHLEQTLSM